MAVKPSAVVDTRVIYCGDNLEQLRKLPDGCVDLIYIDPPFNSNRNYEVFYLTKAMRLTAAAFYVGAVLMVASQVKAAAVDTGSLDQQLAAIEHRSNRWGAAHQLIAIFREQKFGLVVSNCTALLAHESEAHRRAFLLTCRGDAYIHENGFDHAAADFTEATRFDPGVGYPHGGLGYIYTVQGREEEAIKEYDAATRLTPHFLPPYDNRGALYRHKGDFPKAIADYISSIRLDPKDADGFIGLGICHYYMGERDKAKGEIAKGASLIGPSPSFSGTLNELAWFRATCPDEAFRNGKEAVLMATRACQFRQWHKAATIDTLAAAYAEVADYDKAIKYEKQALSVGGGTATARSRMADHLKLYEQHQPYRAHLSDG